MDIGVPAGSSEQAIMQAIYRACIWDYQCLPKWKTGAKPER